MRKRLKQMRETAAFLLAVVMTAGGIPSGMLTAFAAETPPAASGSTDSEKTAGTLISAARTWGNPGGQAKLTLSMENNPGIVGLTLQIIYDTAVMSVAKAENGTAVKGDNIQFTPPNSGNNYVWNGVSVKPDEISDGNLLTLTFDVKEGAKPGDYPVVVSCVDAIDNNLKPVSVTVSSGSVSVIDYIPGDATGDGRIAMNDLVILTQYIADGGYNPNGYAAKINEAACDVNADRQITVLDSVILARFIADRCVTNPNGYNITLLPAPFSCKHADVRHVEAVKAASCQESGNIEYWFCEDCSKYFSDEACNTEITKEATVTRGEHKVVIDAAVAPTAEKTGLTEGAHCSVCNEILTKQETVPKLKEKGDYAITYNIAGSDTYLAKAEIQNPNPKSYSTGDTFRLKELEVPGYTFEGWYDGQGANAARIASIKADDSGDIMLYAHWSVNDYTVTLDSDTSLPNYKQELTSLTYTVDKGAVLPNMSLNGYYFVGWANEDCEIIKSIEPGTVGNFKLHPIWTSRRNSTHPNNYQAEGPVSVTEWDDEDGNANISFIYNIGTIENVPLYPIGNWMNSTAVKQTEIKTVQDSISNECAKSYVQAVSEATTNSASMTLSKEWNETIDNRVTDSSSVSQEQRQAAERYFEDNNEYCISSGTGGNHTFTTSDGISNKVSIGSKLGAEIGANIPLGGEAALTPKLSGEISTGVEKGWTHNDTMSQSYAWNTNTSQKMSQKNGGSQSFSNAITQSLSHTSEYGRLVSNTEGTVQTNATEHSQSTSNSYSNTFAYSTKEETITTVEFQLDNVPEGYYRRVMVGTATVFAIVSYNFANQQFYVNTYSVMDPKSYNPYWDYSNTSTTFTDHQNGVLPFAVPFAVNQYIGDLTVKTNGITVDKETGIVNGYTGKDTAVIIPKYISYNNADKTYTSIKVTGIAPDVFAGNKDIQAVFLPDSVTAIPAGAFKNCTALEAVFAENIQSIGTSAFQNCTALENYTVSSSIESIGKGAFANAGFVTVNAANAATAAAACECGAASIVLNLKDCTEALENMTLTVPDTAKLFKLEGAGKTLTNVRIVSDAESTEIQNVTMNNTAGRPLTISSKSLKIGTTRITAPSIAAALLAENTAVTAYGQSGIVTTGEYAILSRSAAFSGTGDTDIARLNVTGNIGVCGTIEGEKLVNFISGKTVKIDEDEFERLQNNQFTITLDAKGGTLASDTMTAFTDTALGTLPTPTRKAYTFTGWFTESGTQVMSSTVFTKSEDITLYAQWKENAWSNWSTVKPAGDNLEIESRQVLKGYNMVSYWIKDRNGYDNLCFRSFSIPATDPSKPAADVVYDWGGSYEYGHRSFVNLGGSEKEFFSADVIKSAMKLAPGGWYNEPYAINADEKATGYVLNFKGTALIAFIDSEVYETQYRYR